MQFPGSDNNYGGGYNQGGYNQGGYNQGGGGGYNQGGSYNQGGYNQGGGYDQGGYNQSSSASTDVSGDMDFSGNEQPWEIAARFAGQDRDIGSMDTSIFQDAFSTSRNIHVEGNASTFKDAHNQTSSAARGGGGIGLGTKMIAGAAAWAAMSWYINRQKQQGKKVNHQFLKKLVAGIAMVQAVKFVGNRTSGGGFGGLLGGGSRDINSRDVAAEAAAMSEKLVDEQIANGSIGQDGGYNDPLANSNAASNVVSLGGGGSYGSQQQSGGYGGGHDQQQGGYNNQSYGGSGYNNQPQGGNYGGGMQFPGSGNNFGGGYNQY